jgi:hypothetical protein
MAGVTMRHRLGYYLGAAACVWILFTFPAHAATETLPVAPVTSQRNIVAGEDPVLEASVRLPRGRADHLEDVGLYWTAEPKRARCRTFVIVSAYASPRFVELPRGARRGQAATVTLKTATGNRQVVADSHTLREPDFGFNRVLRLQLPSGLIPAYPRRSITVMAVTFRSAAGCTRQTKRAARIADRALQHVTIAVPETYTPPPPLDPPKPIDLATTPGLLMQGAARRDEAGGAVAAAGDVNGDGLADVVVTSPYAAAGDLGTATVVFGRAGGGTLNLGSIGSAGFQITGPARGTFALPAAGIGDLDGDGLGDLAVGAPAANREGGAVYVIRGSASSEPVDLAKPGSRLLFKIAGGRPCRDVLGGGGDNLGASVAAVGDANGDGLPDVAVLSPHNCADPDGGGIYIVFGSRKHDTVDIYRLGARGIAAPADYEAQFDNAVISGAGDTNGDGLADLIVGRGDSGSDVPVAEIIPGRRSGATVRLARLRFQMRGHVCNDGSESVAAAGDVNGDGLGDVVVAAGADACEVGLGVAYVVFGTRRPGPVDLLQLGDRGIKIHGLPDSVFGAGVAGTGDVNGDGLADVAVADSDADVFGRRLAGEVFLVPGRREPGTIELRWAARSGALAWGGAGRYDRLGEIAALAGIGDFDGDGRPDLLAGAPGAGRNGAAYVLPMP